MAGRKAVVHYLADALLLYAYKCDAVRKKHTSCLSGGGHVTVRATSYSEADVAGVGEMSADWNQVRYKRQGIHRDERGGCDSAFMAETSMKGQSVATSAAARMRHPSRTHLARRPARCC